MHIGLSRSERRADLVDDDLKLAHFLAGVLTLLGV
jgi:hypothetical protein